jgi:hypothetical protein
VEVHVIVAVLVGPKCAVGSAACAAACTGALPGATLALAAGGGDWWVGGFGAVQLLGMMSQGCALKIDMAAN